MARQDEVGIFDPEGGGYDYASALAAGISPDTTGHWPSREPTTGLLLKGRKHPTFHKTLAAEKKLGYRVFQGPDGRWYSQPKPPREDIKALLSSVPKFRRGGK